MKAKYLLLSIALTATSLPNIVFAKSSQTESMQSSAVTQTEYQTDWIQYEAILEQVDPEAMVVKSLDHEDVIDQQELKKAIKALKNTINLIEKTQFTTVEGKQVQQNLIAFSKEVMKVYVEHKQWQSDADLEKKYIDDVMIRAENVLSSVDNLRALVGEQDYI